jgi:hypothetical protein
VPRSEKRMSGVISFLGIKKWRLRQKDPWQCLVKTTLPDTSLRTMAPPTFLTHTGDAKQQVHLRPTNANSRLLSRLWSRFDSRCHLCSEHHPPQPVTLPEVNVSKSSICFPNMRIYIHLFPVLKPLPSIHLPRIPSTIQTLSQICCLMNKHPLGSILSVVWWCSWDSVRRPEHSIQRTCQWWPTLVQCQSIMEIIIILNSRIL